MENKSPSARTRLLTLAGASGLTAAWVRRKCKTAGVTVLRVGKNLELRRGQQAILLAPKHAFYAPQICSHFDNYFHAVAILEGDGMRVADYSVQPELLNVCRLCLLAGVRVERRESEICLIKDQRVMLISPRHSVYVLEMAQKFDLYFAPLVPEERDGLQVLDYSQPCKLQTYKGSGLQFELASFPEEEEAIEEYFRWYRPQQGDLVYDMGAHCGVSTYHLSQMVGPSGRVVAFEPDPINFAILQRNLERLGLTNVTAVSAAISGVPGRLSFSSEGTIGSSLTSVLQRETHGSTVTVDALTLAQVFEKWGTPTFCKIDIEGAEVDVVAKSADVLRHSKIQLAFDTNHPKANGEMTNVDLEPMLRNYGYEVVSEANPLLTTWARPQA